MRFALCLAPLLAASLIVGAARAHELSPAPAPSSRVRGFEPAAAGSYRLPALGPAADGEVLDATGQSTRLYELFEDRAVLLSFIYGSCDDANGCPLSLAILDRVRARCAADPELAQRTRLITLSFDPERDTPEVMRKLGAAFRAAPADWSFLTTASQAQLAPILEAYGQSVGRVTDAEGRPTGQLAHVLRVFLIDAYGQIRNVYSSSFLYSDVLVNDLQTLLLESDSDASRAHTREDVAARSTAPDAAEASPMDLLALAEHPPLGLPPLPEPSGMPLTRARIELGRKLFFDRRLSENATLSCAMCHIPGQGFTSQELATAVGFEGHTVRRNAPTLYNVAYAQRLFHDGRETRLERQVWGPLLTASEMGNPSAGSVLDRLAALPDYPGLFERAFADERPTQQTLGAALASYERTLLSGNSPFDRWHFGHDPVALPDAAIRGFHIFSGRAGCSACHLVGGSSALFTDQELHNTGIGYRRATAERTQTLRVKLAPGDYVDVDRATLRAVSEPPPSDLGLYEITEDPRDRWKYKTPSLRNVALTAPYMHDGSLATLRRVVAFYNAGGVPNELLDPRIRPLDLSSQEVSDLVAFLESLTGDNADLLALDAEAAPVGDPR